MTDNSTLIDIEDIYELSPMQLGMLFQSMLAPDSGVFVEQQAMRLAGAVVPAHFERVWQGVVDRTPVLRTSFHWGDLEKPVQVIHRQVPIKIERLDWRRIPASATRNQMARYLRDERSRGFDLGEAPLMRIALVQSSGAESWFVWHFHHLLLDGWSGQLLLQEVVDQYLALSSGKTYVSPVRPPFRDYIAWLQSQNEAEAEAFWRAELRGFSVPTTIGIGRTRTTVGLEGNDGEWAFTLSEQDSQILRTFAKTHRITLNTLVQGAWGLLLSQYSGESDVVFGVVVSGRPPELPGVEAMIGLFINTLPARVRIINEQSVVTWLQRLQTHQMGLARFQYASSLQVQQWSEVPNGTRLYDTLVVFENFPTAAKQGAQSPETEEPLYSGRTDVAITLVVVPGTQIRMKLLYDHRRFEEREIEQLALHLSELIRKLAVNEENLLGNVSLLTNAQRHKMLVEWNATAAPGYDVVPLMELLRKQAELTPNAVAFIEGQHRASIRSIHEDSNRFANYLASLGVGPGSIVGVCCERSVQAVIAFLALLKLRAVFLPLDPSYPLERLTYMVRDANASVVLGLDASLASDSLVLDWNEASQGASHFSDECSLPDAQPEDTAYIIYTSGSTGRPKGVAVPHRVLLNRLTWMWREYPFLPGEVGVMKTALNFVDAFWEMLGGLLQGVPTVVAPQNVVTDPNAFVDLLALHSVTRLWFVPSLLEMLLETCPNLGRRLPALRFWSSGGEPLSVDLYHRFKQAVPHGVLYNVFGASELWDATVFDPEREGAVTDCVPIGRPIANTQVFILDARHQPVPVGVTGTLHIGGASLARGYVNQDELSRQRFIPHLFSNQPGASLYNTGDLARFRPDGVIEYVGRRDLQIKVRGFRVEPTEIENLIDSYPEIRESVVVSRPTDQRLIAYVVPRNGDRDTGKLLAHLAEWLPSFMIPAITWISEIPMTPSGKRDRNRLAQTARNGDRGTTDMAAMTPLESLVARHFCEVLGVSSVGLTDDFFADLGGHSLLATRLLAGLRTSTGCDIPLRAIFDAPTPGALAAVIGQISGDEVLDLETESILADLAALPAEESDALLQSLKMQAEGDEA
ncbi:MAG TPA: amino acid adenylation domain-containing protein [Pyrinomonadaceae bacterium]|nr:amino acid adenylation domain-containing protein [Pyrinomonadaceae bacterium]